jgi:hypothetical protein
MEKLEKVVGNMSTSNVEPFKAGFDDVAAVDRDAVGDTITAIEKHGSIHALSKERHQCLHAVLYPIHLEFLEHDFHHAYFVGHWVHDRFRYEDG